MKTSARADMQLARRVLQAEADAIGALADQLGPSFAEAAETIFQCTGQVITTGIGKAGIIGRKLSATFASTGTPSIWIHPVEALHGDLGRVQRDDVVLVLTHSGETEEVVRLIDHIAARGARIVAMTGNGESTVARHADVCLCYGQIREACPHGLAPTASTTCMLALGDSLALTVMDMRHFSPEDFGVFHPGGSLGRKLMKVEEAMSFHQDQRLRLIRDDLDLGQALAQAEKVSRRTGAMLLVDAEDRLSGILTDADLRRALLARRQENLLAAPVCELMTPQPKHIHVGQLASEALAILNQFRIDELPVVDDDHHPVGVIDVQDLLGIKTFSHVRD